MLKKFLLYNFIQTKAWSRLINLQNFKINYMNVQFFNKINKKIENYNSTKNLIKKEDNVNLDVYEEDFDVIAERIVKALAKIDKDCYILGSNLVRDPLSEPSLNKMENENETASRPINRFRQIIYNEGELKETNLSLPPSRENPHPFNPNMLPPTHGRTLAAYVNHLPILQQLIDLGVDLFEIDISTNIGRHLIRQNWEKDVKPKIYWLVKDVGVKANVLGSYLTRNPYFLLQKFDDLKRRIQYLYSKNFSKTMVATIVVKNRYWLNTDEKIIDRRLGFMQRQFRLKGSEVREIVLKEPRIMLFGIGPMQKLVLTLNKELGFSFQQIKQMLKEDPRLFMFQNSNQIVTIYNYLTKVMLISIEQIAAFPLALRITLNDLKTRHEFLHRLKKAQYNENLPNCILLKELLCSSDKYFAEKVANSFIADYNKFLKCL